MDFSNAKVFKLTGTNISLEDLAAVARARLPSTTLSRTSGPPLPRVDLATAPCAGLAGLSGASRGPSGLASRFVRCVVRAAEEDAQHEKSKGAKAHNSPKDTRTRGSGAGIKAGTRLAAMFWMGWLPLNVDFGGSAIKDPT